MLLLLPAHALRRGGGAAMASAAAAASGRGLHMAAAAAAAAVSASPSSASTSTSTSRPASGVAQVRLMSSSSSSTSSISSNGRGDGMLTGQRRLCVLPAWAASSLPGRRGMATGGGSGDKEQPAHFKLVLPDMGQSTKSGSVTAWRKEEGDFVKNGDVVCEVEMDEFTVGMEIDDKGYLARILVPAGTKDVPVGEALAVLVYNEKDVNAFNHLAPYHPAKDGDGGGGEEEGAPADATALLKCIHKLVRAGQIKDAEFAKRLQALARHENKELLRVFEASFESPEGSPRREEDFDLEFFLENAHGVVEDHAKAEQPHQKQQQQGNKAA